MFARDESSFTDQLSSDHIYCHDFILSLLPRGGRGVLPYIGYTGMCHWRGYGFQAIWSGIGSSNPRKLV